VPLQQVGNTFKVYWEKEPSYKVPQSSASLGTCVSGVAPLARIPSRHKDVALPSGAQGETLTTGTAAGTSGGWDGGTTAKQWWWMVWAGGTIMLLWVANAF